MMRIFGNPLFQSMGFYYLPEMSRGIAGRYFSAIDGLRLLASVNIVLFHFQRMGGLYDLRGSPGWLFTIIKGPLFHASLFFMLGGFIFTVKFAHRAKSFHSRTFWKKRFLDLYPLHAATTLLMVPLLLISAVPGAASPGEIFRSCLVHLALLYAFMPMGVLPMNRPSWALSGFTLCYLLFKPLLVFIGRFQKRSALFGLMALCLVPSLAWAYFFSLTPWSHSVYFFYHIFAPVRLFEFILGMAIARLYILNEGRATVTVSPGRRLFSDAVVIGSLVLLFCCCKYKTVLPHFWQFQLYHTWMLPPYTLLLYFLCREHGYLSRLFTIPWVRRVGQSSFYPYLLHIPLIGWICWFCEQKLAYRTFLHHTYTIAAFLVVLYLSSAWIWHRVHKRRATPPPFDPSPNYGGGIKGRG